MEKSSLKLNLYCSSEPGSKSYWAFEALEQSWPYGTERVGDLADEGIHVFWGLVKHNGINIKEVVKRRQPYIFIDMPYWDRWVPGADPSNSRWRVIVNGLHVSAITDYPNNRCQHIELKPWQNNSDGHVLVCPSSRTLNNFYAQPWWTKETCNLLKEYTDLDIRIREKPRSNGTSGPSVAEVSLEDDLNGAYCTVTMSSIVAVESIIAGIPSICSPYSAAAPCSVHNLSDIDSLVMPDRQKWLNTLSYNQWSIKELANGFAVPYITEQLEKYA